MGEKSYRHAQGTYAARKWINTNHTVHVHLTGTIKPTYRMKMYWSYIYLQSATDITHLDKKKHGTYDIKPSLNAIHAIPDCYQLRE